MRFEEGDRKPDNEAKSIFGVVTGDFNVSDALQELHGGLEAIPDHELTFFDKSRRTLLTQVSRPRSPSKSETTTLWSAPALRFHARTGTKYGPVEVLDVGSALLSVVLVVVVVEFALSIDARLLCFVCSTGLC